MNGTVMEFLRVDELPSPIDDAPVAARRCGGEVQVALAERLDGSHLVIRFLGRQGVELSIERGARAGALHMGRVTLRLTELALVANAIDTARKLAKAVRR